MNRRFWQDSGALGHGDGIRTLSVKNFIDDSVHGSIPVLSDFAIKEKQVLAFTKKSSYRMTPAENGILSMFGILALNSLIEVKRKRGWTKQEKSIFQL